MIRNLHKKDKRSQLECIKTQRNLEILFGLLDLQTTRWLLV